MEQREEIVALEPPHPVGMLAEPRPLDAGVVPQCEGGKCRCGGSGSPPEEAAKTPPAYVYALGRIEPRFPGVAVEKEFAQATGRAGTAGLTDRQALHAVLTERSNRYLARKLCWVFAVEGIETYLLFPRDPADLDLLVEAVRPRPRASDVDVVIGTRGPVAPPQMCNGLTIPIVAFDQLYSFDVDSLIKSIPRPDKSEDQAFEPAAEELFTRILRMADNAGATPENRALNYLLVRYHAIYAMAADAFRRNRALDAVEVRPSPLGTIRRLVDVIFTFNDRTTDVAERFFVRVDVTEQFPFLVTKLSPFYEH